MFIVFKKQHLLPLKCLSQALQECGPPSAHQPFGGLHVACGLVPSGVTDMVLEWLYLCDGPCEFLTRRGTISPTLLGGLVW